MKEMEPVKRTVELFEKYKKQIIHSIIINVLFEHYSCYCDSYSGTTCQNVLWLFQLYSFSCIS